MTDTRNWHAGASAEDVERGRQAIIAIIDCYRRGFATMDTSLLKGIWDPRYDIPIYIAQEPVHPFPAPPGRTPCPPH